VIVKNMSTTKPNPLSSTEIEEMKRLQKLTEFDMLVGEKEKLRGLQYRYEVNGQGEPLREKDMRDPGQAGGRILR